MNDNLCTIGRRKLTVEEIEGKDWQSFHLNPYLWRSRGSKLASLGPCLQYKVLEMHKTPELNIFSQRGAPILFVTRHTICDVDHLHRPWSNLVTKTAQYLSDVKWIKLSTTHHPSEELFRRKPVQFHEFGETALRDCCWAGSEGRKRDMDLIWDENIRYGPPTPRIQTTMRVST
jgi:hypothetical protein